MKLSFSNIAWTREQDEQAYRILCQNGFEGLEIAPTRFFSEHPYAHLSEIAEIRGFLEKSYGLHICSMQSILNGKTGNLFDKNEAEMLLTYLEKAFLFGEAAGGCNFVFGCPRNRTLPDGLNEKNAVPFFSRATAAARAHGCVLSLEANPPMYGTNFINNTKAAFSFVKMVPDLKVNLDFGTIINQRESLQVVKRNMKYVNHVHISEPGLVPVVQRKQHLELADILREGGYNGYVSVEMKQTEMDIIQSVTEYVREIFG